jgi:hypothetical protein
MRLRHSLLVLAPSICLALGGCAHGRIPVSYLPVGAPAQYGDRTLDGIVLLFSAPEATVRAGVARALEANGYEILSNHTTSRILETAARAVNADTTLAVRAEIIPEDPSGGGVVVVLSGTYNVPSSRIRNARVVQRPGEQSPLYRRLGVVADTTRRFISGK